MPQAAPKACSQCGALSRTGRCDRHAVKAGSFSDRRRGTRHERNYGTAWDKLRAETMREQAGICQPHLRRGEIVTGCRIVDHVVAREFGGGEEPENRQCICSECHDLKTTVEKLVARGVRPSVDPAILASLTPPGVVIGRVQTGLSPRGRAGQKSGGAPARTDRFAGFCTAEKTTPPGVKRVRVR